MSIQRRLNVFVLTVTVFTAVGLAGRPKSLSIFHFDVNTGDATLILTPAGRGILIDAGDRSRGKDPIIKFLDRAKADGRLTSLDYTIATHYDADHIGGMDEVLKSQWHPQEAALDRGDIFLPPFNHKYVEEHCRGIDPNKSESIVQWGTAPSSTCGRKASCQIIQYFTAAKAKGKRKTVKPGDVLKFDNGIRLTTLVVNAKDIDGHTVDVHFNGRKPDCAANDLSIGMLLEYGQFRYLIAGDLTGVRAKKVANVEKLIMDDAKDVDVYRINHHGSDTSSSDDFVKATSPTVVIVSNGKKFQHPREKVIKRILTLQPKPVVYLTNRPDMNNSKAWKAPKKQVADENYKGYDGTIEISVGREKYRVFRWRDGKRIDKGDLYEIKPSAQQQ